MQKFVVDIDTGKVEEIVRRVRTRRLPKRAAGVGWSLGVEQGWFDGMLDYWQSEYSWLDQQERINQLDQFTHAVEEKTVHFAHHPCSDRGALPLLLLHGWPYSFYSFSEVIPRLAQSLHVVAPSLPGSLFSEPCDDKPFGLRRVAAVLHRLMAELGYAKYVVQGSDHGAVIADWLALDFPGAVIAEQTNLVAYRHQGAEYASGETGVDDATPAEQSFVADEKENFQAESAYFELQRTRPETIAYALNDSPTGAAAYLWDKWQKWTDLRERDLQQVYGRDRLVTELMLYLVTDSLATSIWSYSGLMLDPFSIPKGRSIDVPFGFAGYPDPLNSPPPRSFVERSRSHIVQWKVNAKGGHFPFLEDPSLFCSDLQAFLKAL